ncbi:gamma-glutamyltransferase [Pseudoroseomonas wenyumeiae]
MRSPVLALLMLLGATPALAEATSALDAQPRAAARATRQMVAAAHPLAAEAGLAMLRQGGTAVDAAIAAQVVLTLVEPQSSGIGGGALLMHWNAARRRVSAWDGRETAPAAATPGLFLKPDGTPMPFYEAVLSGRSVGVPGVMPMLAAAHAVEGRLPWADLFAPAIKLAEEGFAISPPCGADRSRCRAPEAQPGRRGLFLHARRRAAAGRHHPQEPGPRTDPAGPGRTRRRRAPDRSYRRRDRGRRAEAWRCQQWHDGG